MAVRNLFLVVVLVCFFAIVLYGCSDGYTPTTQDWCAMIDKRNHDSRCDNVNWQNHTPTKNGNRVRTPVQGVFDQGYYDEIY